MRWSSLLSVAFLGAMAGVLFKPRFSIAYPLSKALKPFGLFTENAFFRENQARPSETVYSSNADYSQENVPGNSAEEKGLEALLQEFQRQYNVLPISDDSTQNLTRTWQTVVRNFFWNIPLREFSKDTITLHYSQNRNNVRDNCILVTISEGTVNVTKSFPPGRHSRYSSAIYILHKILLDSNRQFPDATFLVMLNDGQKPLVPTLGVAKHWTSWKYMIPVPLGNTRGEAEGWGTPIEEWDMYINETIVSKRTEFPWERKINKAVFRGALLMQTWKLGTCNRENDGNCEKSYRWDDVARGAMYRESQKRPELFDIGFTKHGAKSNHGIAQFEGAPEPNRSIPFGQNQKYKFILSAGSNQDWAERLRNLLFTNSAVIIHQAETQEFFHPLLIPWRHYIPTNLHFTDLVENVEWATQHDSEVREIAHNMNHFARQYLTEKAMELYWKVALLEYAARQHLDVH